MSTGNDGKRTQYLSWDEYFMGVALISAQRSKDPVTQVGAVIVNDDKRILSTGYNGMPNGCSDDDLPWSKVSPNPLERKKLFVCHAEMNAVLNHMTHEIKGSKMFVTLYPCNECAKVIIQAGIKEVVYYDKKQKRKDEYEASEQMLKKAGVKVSEYKRHNRRLQIGELLTSKL